VSDVFRRIVPSELMLPLSPVAAQPGCPEHIALRLAVLTSVFPLALWIVPSMAPALGSFAIVLSYVGVMIKLAQAGAPRASEMTPEARTKFVRRTDKPSRKQLEVQNA
jgi:hypothetical protein